MSNFLAVATVTETLRQMLDTNVNKDVSGGARATAVRPASPDKSSMDGLPEVGVNVYLYQISFNTAWRNADLPTRRGDGTLIQRPRAALNLNYLLTFYGEEKQLEPQRVLGSVIRALHAQPMLTRQQIQSSVEAVDFLQDSDLADEVEQVKFTPIPLSVEELHNLWSGFFQAPYVLSTAYQASVVFIEGKETPREALPVRVPGLSVISFRQPIIEQVRAQGNQPIIMGAGLIILGRNLQGDLTRVRIGEVEIEPDEIDENRIELQLSSPPFPQGSLRAGVKSIQVVHKSMIGSPPTPHPGFESNALAFILRPVIKSVGVLNVHGNHAAVSGEMSLQVEPQIGKNQRVALLLNEISGISGDSRAAYIFAVPRRNADVDTISAAFEGVKAGDYLVRLQVDGAESLLFADDDSRSSTYGQYTAPKLTIDG